MNKLSTWDTDRHRWDLFSAVWSVSRSAFLALIVTSGLSGCPKTEKPVEATGTNIIRSCDRILRNESLSETDIETYFRAIDMGSKEIYIQEQVQKIEKLLWSIWSDTDIRTLMILEGWRQMREKHMTLTIAMEAYEKNESDPKKVIENKQKTIHKMAVDMMWFISKNLWTYYLTKREVLKTCSLV